MILILILSIGYEQLVNSPGRRVQETQIKKAEIQLQEKQLDANIIYDKFDEISELILQRGVLIYTNKITDKGFLNTKTLDLKLRYTYGLGIELNKIKVRQVISNVAYIQISIDQIKLKYVELDLDDSKVIGTKSILAKQFKPETIHIIMKQAQQKVSDTINMNRSLFRAAEKNLEKEIKGLLLSLGFDDVVFNVN